MPVRTLSDREVAVTIDSLSAMREQVIKRGADAPDITEALGKLASLIQPDTYELIVATDRFAAFSDWELETMQCALQEDIDAYPNSEDKEKVRVLADEVQQACNERPELAAKYAN